MKNIINMNEFKNKKVGAVLKESTVNKIGDNWLVNIDVPVPVSLINAFIKKVKDESGQNLRDTSGDQQIADKIANYIVNSYLNIENLPVSLAIGDKYTAAPVQPETQQVQSTQGQVQNIQPTQDELTAQEIPAQETQTGGVQTTGTQETQTGGVQTTGVQNVQTIQAQ